MTVAGGRHGKGGSKLTSLVTTVQCGMDQVDRTTLGPPDDTPILPWYGGTYARGFMILNPFFEVEGLDPKSCEYGSVILERGDCPADADLLEWMDAEAARRSAGKETTIYDVDVAARLFGKQVGWRQLCGQVDFSDHCALDRALRTSIGGLRHDLADRAGADRLASHCARHRIFRPREGRFEPLIQRGLTDLFREAGFEEIIVGDEFGDDERCVDIDLLERGDPWDVRPELSQYGVRRLIAPDRSILACVHWDSFYTLLLFAETQRSLGVESRFEGFWCSDQTTTYWLFQDPIPCTSGRGSF